MSSFYKFLEVDAKATPDAQMGKELLTEELTGLIIRNFLSEEEVASILEGLKELQKENKTIVNDGFISYPMSFAQYTQMRLSGTMSEKDYVNVAHHLRHTFPDKFGVDVEGRIAKYLSTLFGEAGITPIHNPEFNDYLVPFTFRELLPGKGELIAHCENLFFDEFPQFFDWLRKMNIKDNKLSYFLTLQNTEEGGELCCFELNWKDVKKRFEANILQRTDGRIIDLDSESSPVEKTYIKPNAGDLLLFGGGNVWHRVEKVKGGSSRVTLGGFIAETFKENEYYLWS